LFINLKSLTFFYVYVTGFNRFLIDDIVVDKFTRVTNTMFTALIYCLNTWTCQWGLCLLLGDYRLFQGTDLQDK